MARTPPRRKTRPLRKTRPGRNTGPAGASKPAGTSTRDDRPGLEAANQAAGKNAERLRRLGAHAISIKPGASAGSGHVIEVYVPEDFKGTMPKAVSTTVHGKRVDVP